MKILITGGFGYIGGRLINFLRERSTECEILIADRISDYGKSWASNIEKHYLELLSEESIEKCIKDAKPECIIHLAALNENDSAKDPDLAGKVNNIGTKLLVEKAQKYNVKKFIYFSTFHVYGKSISGIIDEKTKPQPTHPYATTHFQAEEHVARLRKEGLSTLIFRLSNSYGCPADVNIDRWTLLVNDLCLQAIKSSKLVLSSSGHQKRDFISLKNVVEAVRFFLFDINDRWGDGLYNLGEGRTRSVYEMAEKVKSVYENKYNKKLEITISPKAQNKSKDITDFIYSIDKLKKAGFEPGDFLVEEISKIMDVCEGLI